MKSLRFNTIDPNSESVKFMIILSMQEKTYLHIYILTFHNVYQVDELACHAAQMFLQDSVALPLSDKVL